MVNRDQPDGGDTAAPRRTLHRAGARNDEGERDPTLGRRRHERHLCERLCVVTEVDELGNPSANWECRVVDLSRGGIGLRSRRMVHINRGVFVELGEKNGSPARLLFGIVRQSRYAEGEGYVVGIQFAPTPQSTVIRQWLAHRKRESAKPTVD